MNPEPTSSDDEALVRRALAGDVSAFEGLVKRHERTVFGIAWQSTRNEQSAEDLTQEAFLNAWKSLHRYQSDLGAFSTWLHAITRNLCRKQWHRQSTGPASGIAAEPACHHSEPDVATSNRETFALLDQSLAELPDEFRIAFIFAVLEGLPLADVAAMERVPVGTIKSRVSRARAHLRSALNELDHQL